MTSAATSRGDGMLCCDIGRARFAFRGSDVRHVERAEFIRADRGGDGRVGTLRLGGQQVPVFSLGEVLGMTPEKGGSATDQHIAVTGDRHALTGWLVDRIERAARPASGDVTVLPPMVGAQATSWFEGLVWMAEGESALLIAPHHLNTPPIGVVDSAPAFDRPASPASPAPEPVAVVFSTTVLPSSATQRFALSARQVAAIVQPSAPIPLPGCHDYVRGLTWWHRCAVPVIDFRAPADRHTAHARYVIAQCGVRQHASLVAFPIDAEVVMCRPADEHQVLPDVTCPPFASGVFDVNGEAVALLDLEALLMPTHVALTA